MNCGGRVSKSTPFRAVAHLHALLDLQVLLLLRVLLLHLQFAIVHQLLLLQVKVVVRLDTNLVHLNHTRQGREENAATNEPGGKRTFSCASCMMKFTICFTVRRGDAGERRGRGGD